VVTDFSGGHILWFTGLSGAGKSTIARALNTKLRKRNVPAIVLDGDELRTGLNADLGYSEAERTENLRRIAHVANLFLQQGFVTIVATISPEQKHRDAARAIVGKRFTEILIDAPLEVCEARDPKGLYKRARHGDIPNFTGVAAPYDRPVNPDISLDTQALSVDECVQTIMDFLERHACHDITELHGKNG